MGSLPSPPRPPTPSPPSLSSSPQNQSPPNFRVYASFCLKEPTPKINISNWIECYNPSDNAWSHISSIPGLIENRVLKDFSMIALGNSIYIIGGRLCHKIKIHVSDSNEFVDENDDVLSSVWRYNVQSDQWLECVSLNVPRYDFACTVYENKIYVAGGKSTLASARGISSAEVYDPSLDKWTPLPNMSTLRYKCVGVTWQGKVHAVGGFAERGDSDRTEPFITERSSAEVYDTEAGKWELAAGMWQLDVPPNQIVAVENTLFSSGDCLKAWKGHIEAYDGKLNIWNEVDGSHLQTLSSPISTSDQNWPPTQQIFLTMAPIGTHLYFLAGYRKAGEISQTVCTVHKFDTEASGDAWRSFEPREEEGEKELCSHCCVVQLL